MGILRHFQYGLSPAALLMLVAYHIYLLRNWTMAATFLASTAILIGLGIFNVAVTADKQGELSLLISHFGSDHPGLWVGKLILPADTSTAISVEDTIDILDRSGAHYTLGMRGYYLAIPLALWLFGPLWMLSGTLLLLVTFYRLDRGI